MAEILMRRTGPLMPAGVPTCVVWLVSVELGVLEQKHLHTPIEKYFKLWHKKIFDLVLQHPSRLIHSYYKSITKHKAFDCVGLKGVEIY